MAANLYRSTFQLHHTGIKTSFSTLRPLKKKHFNCTIQELKLEAFMLRYNIQSNFNCTIQELKLKMKRRGCDTANNFNCTIQELKHDNRLTSLSI